MRRWETVIESQRVNISVQHEGHKSTLTRPERKLKEYTTRLKNWLDTDKGNRKLQRHVAGMGGIGLHNLHGLAWQEGSWSNSWGKYIKNWDTYCLCSRDKKEWIHKLVDPLSGKSTPVFKEKKKIPLGNSYPASERNNPEVCGKVDKIACWLLPKRMPIVSPRVNSLRLGYYLIMEH